MLRTSRQGAFRQRCGETRRDCNSTSQRVRRICRTHARSMPSALSTLKARCILRRSPARKAHEPLSVRSVLEPHQTSLLFSHGGHPIVAVPLSDHVPCALDPRLARGSPSRPCLVYWYALPDQVEVEPQSQGSENTTTGSFQAAISHGLARRRPGSCMALLACAPSCQPEQNAHCQWALRPPAGRGAC
jgi:hypothetical protein